MPIASCPSQMNSARPNAQRKDVTPGSIEGGRRCTDAHRKPWGNLPVPPNPFHWSASRTDATRRTKSSPSRLRFRPPPPLTFPFRVLPSGATSSYSRSVLGASSTLTSWRKRSRGPKRRFRKLRPFLFPTVHERFVQVDQAPKRRKSRSRAGPKKFAEPVSLSSPASADLPLPGTAFGLGFDLLALRARRKQQSNVCNKGVKGSRKDVAAICGNFFSQHFHSLSSNMWTRLWRGS